MADEHENDTQATQALSAQPNDTEQQSPFERIRHTDEQGDYWLARELMPLLEYGAWQDFENAIRKAIEDSKKSGRDVEEHFGVFRRSPKNSKAGGRSQKDYRLTRYACDLIVMHSRTTGEVAARARTYFSDKVKQAETFDQVKEAVIPDKVKEAETQSDSDTLYLDWRERAMWAFIAEGYSAEWAKRRVDDLAARNALTHEWSVRGIKQREYAILTNRLHMGAFGLTIEEHKGIKSFPITYKGKKLVYQGDLPPAMTITELGLNALASDVARGLHIKNDSQGFQEIAGDVDVAGRITGDTRRQIEAALGQPVVSPRNMLREPDGGLWAQLPAPTSGRE